MGVPIPNLRNKIKLEQFSIKKMFQTNADGTDHRNRNKAFDNKQISVSVLMFLILLLNIIIIDIASSSRHNTYIHAYRVS